MLVGEGTDEREQVLVSEAALALERVDNDFELFGRLHGYLLHEDVGAGLLVPEQSLVGTAHLVLD